MAYAVKVITHSINCFGEQLITIELTYPRIVHSEVMTHRMFSRNSASTRAISLESQLKNLLSNPFVPEHFGTNMRGMQPGLDLVGAKHDQAAIIWLQGRDRALTTFLELILGESLAERVLGYESNRDYVDGSVITKRLDTVLAHVPSTAKQLDLSETDILNVHKQLAGRVLEPYMWHTIVVTASVTELSNFFGLRIHPDAQEQISTIATMMKEQVDQSTPRLLQEGEWHTPYVAIDEFAAPFDAIRASAARCAAASYNRQAAKKQFDEEVKRYDMLVHGGHMSPLEHQARPLNKRERVLRQNAASMYSSEGRRMGIPQHEITQLIETTKFDGNLRGWRAHRKDIVNEHDFSQIAKR